MNPQPDFENRQVDHKPMPFSSKWSVIAKKSPLELGLSQHPNSWSVHEKVESKSHFQRPIVYSLPYDVRKDPR